MLTLKVVSSDQGNKSTYLLSGERVHYNYLQANSKDSVICDGLILGKMPDTPSSGDRGEDFIYYSVRVTDKEMSIIEDLTIFPYSCCYVMDNGKTVDFFISDFVKNIR